MTVETREVKPDVLRGRRNARNGVRQRHAGRIALPLRGKDGLGRRVGHSGRVTLFGVERFKIVRCYGFEAHPENGPPYAPEFVQRYRAAQVARNDRISDWCHEETARLRAGGAFDRVFPVFRCWADLRFTDLTLDPSERTVGCYFGDPKTANYSPYGLATANTCRSWLDMWSLRESRCRATPHLQKVTVPSLVVQSTADQGCFPSDARKIHDDLASDDKRLEFVPGDHYLQNPANARDDVADLIAAWLAEKA